MTRSWFEDMEHDDVPTYEQARQKARAAKTPGELADAIILAQKVADETLDSVERIIRADERDHVLAELEAYARSHASLKAGSGNTDDILGFIAWYRAGQTPEQDTRGGAFDE